jgi:hypothetical protein
MRNDHANAENDGATSDARAAGGRRRWRRRTVSVLLGLLALGAAATSAGATYQQIRVAAPLDPLSARLLSAVHAEAMGDEDGSLLFLVTSDDAEALREAGLPFEVVIADLQAFYIQRMEQAGGRQGGDFGIFHTYDEMVTEIQNLHDEYPTLTTAPAPIGTTYEGRAIWAFKVSDHPDLQEAEPEVLFDGMHHAREIMTVEIPLAFSRYLCENYQTDPIVTQLVDSRQIWFVPIVNPDGVVYNETISPAGGGMWRKNRRINEGSGCVGVDLNRNYDYQWVGPGSSTDPCNDLYRGPSPASEPEVQALTGLINAHHFITWQSYHSVWGAVLHPWAYTTSDTPDDALFGAIGLEMARDSGYEVGQPGEVIHYNVNGGAFDWGYGATGEHPKIMAFSTEIGGSGFWPDPAERDGLILENRHSDLYLCEVAGAWLELLDLTVDDGGGNGRLDPGESVGLIFTARNPGLLFDAENVHATLSCDDPYIELTDAVADLGTQGAGQEFDSSGDPFLLHVDPACPEGRSVSFTVRLEADGGLDVPATRSLVVGVLPVISSNDFEADAGGWTQDPTHTAETGAFVRIDPEPTEFQPPDDTTPDPGIYAWVTAQNTSVGVDDVDNGISATRSPAFDLSAYDHVRLDLMYFHGQRDSGDDPEDFFRIDLSRDGGATFPVNLVSIGDQLSPRDWQHLQVDLEPFGPLTSQMMLRVQASDGVTTGDIIEAGIDDVLFLDRGDGNEPPGAPSLVAPPDGGVETDPAPVLVVANADDPESDPLTYGFRVYADPELTQVVASVDGVPEGPGTTSWTVDPALAAGTFYWRAFAEDASTRGLYMPAASFLEESASGVPPGSASGQTAALTAAPSPAAGAVQIRYYSPFTSHADLAVFDLEGRRVRTLDGPRWAEGWQDVVWDGRDAGGDRVPAGVYWVRLVLPHEVRTVRVVQVH